MSDETDNALKEKQMKMFGCSVDTMNDCYSETYDKLMLVMQILSDAQEEMHRGNTEVSRQFINRAKYITNRVRMDTRNNEMDMEMG